MSAPRPARPIHPVRRVVRSTLAILLGVGLLIGGRVWLDGRHDAGRPIRVRDLWELFGVATHIPGLPPAAVIQGLLERGYDQQRVDGHLAVLRWGGSTTSTVTLEGEGAELQSVTARIEGPDQETWGRALAVQLADVCLGEAGFDWARECWSTGGELIHGQARATLVRGEDLSTFTLSRY